MTIYRCDDSDRSVRPSVKDATGKRSRTVDFHCHMSVPEATALAKPFIEPGLDAHTRHTTPASTKVNHAQAAAIAPKLTTVEAKLADMDRMGIDVQVLSPAPPQYYYWAEPELGLATSRLINERIAEAVASHPDRFSGLATLPMQAPELAVAELRRAVTNLGLRGIEISTNVHGVELSAARFSPVFAAAEELGVVVFLHPLGFTHGERLSNHYLNNVIGNPLESTIAISHLIFGGVLDAFPRLRICVAHGGGYLPGYSGRMDHAWSAREDCRGSQHKPSSYLRRLFFDTVVFDQEQLSSLVQKYGAGQIVLGSDYPFDMGEPDPVGFVSDLASLSDAEKEAILGGNALRLLEPQPSHLESAHESV